MSGLRRTRRCLQSQFDFPKRQRLSKPQRPFPHLLAVDERPIAGTKVPHHDRIPIHPQFAMHARNRRVVDLKIIVWTPPKPVHAGTQLKRVGGMVSFLKVRRAMDIMHQCYPVWPIKPYLIQQVGGAVDPKYSKNLQFRNPESGLPGDDHASVRGCRDKFRILETRLAQKPVDLGH